MRAAQLLKDKQRQPVEGKNPQPRVTRHLRTREQLAFQLESRLLRREQQERRAVRLGGQPRADFRHAAKRLAAARRPEKKTRLHAPVLAGTSPRRKGEADCESEWSLFEPQRHGGTEKAVSIGRFLCASVSLGAVASDSISARTGWPVPILVV